LVHGKRFGQWAVVKKINLWAAWSLFHLRQSKGEVDWAIWLCCHGDVESATWQCGLGNMDLRIGHYKVCNVAKWTCQHGLGNWALGTLWFGKVHLAPWTWQLGTRDFVIWQSALGTMDLTIGCYGFCDLANVNLANEYSIPMYVFVFFIHECFRNLKRSTYHNILTISEFSYITIVFGQSLSNSNNSLLDK
jgi:hypothetical protein